MARGKVRGLIKKLNTMIATGEIDRESLGLLQKLGLDLDYN